MEKQGPPEPCTVPYKPHEQEFDPKGKFDYDKCIDLLNKLVEGAESGKTDPIQWAAMLIEFVKLFSFLGSALSMAFSGKFPIP